MAVKRSVHIAIEAFKACNILGDEDSNELSDGERQNIIRYLLQKSYTKAEYFTPRNDILFVCLILQSDEYADIMKYVYEVAK